ncbi:Odorant receptor 46a, isoform A [Eumeta japonica]|uniref:Odorant receptor n=1 Tax=Eumeta variegata TaxID=151549 RepID=A0A4C1Y1A2_EUMVA|nr:Odorant receptor 46a, isoform A [Eumeta japonica]
MASHRLSEIFDLNIKSWKLLVMWPIKGLEKWFKYYCFVYMAFTMLLYHALLIANCIYMPLKIEIIMERLLYFTEIALVVKVFAILFNNRSVREIFSMLQDETFRPKNEKDENVIKNAKTFFYRYRRTFHSLCYCSYVFSIVYGLLVHFIWGTYLKLPVSNYSFLSDETKAKYIYIFYLYQSVCLYIHMETNMNADTFLVGLIILATAEVEILCNNLRNIHSTKSKKKELQQLRECIKHFQFIASLGGYGETMKTGLDEEGSHRSGAGGRGGDTGRSFALYTIKRLGVTSKHFHGIPRIFPGFKRLKQAQHQQRELTETQWRAGAHDAHLNDGPGLSRAIVPANCARDAPARKIKESKLSVKFTIRAAAEDAQRDQFRGILYCVRARKPQPRGT